MASSSFVLQMVYAGDDTHGIYIFMYILLAKIPTKSGGIQNLGVIQTRNKLENLQNSGSWFLLQVVYFGTAHVNTRHLQ